jgi:hypothetical protein
LWPQILIWFSNAQALELSFLLGNLIGEFKGTNSSFRVLPEGRMEVSGQGTGKILGIDAMMFFTAVTYTM